MEQSLSLLSISGGVCKKLSISGGDIDEDDSKFASSEENDERRTGILGILKLRFTTISGSVYTWLSD